MSEKDFTEPELLTTVLTDGQGIGTSGAYGGQEIPGSGWNWD